MGLTVTLAGDWLSSIGNRQAVSATIAFDSSYPTGGESLTPAMLGLGSVESVVVEPKSGYMFSYDYTNQKVLAYVSTGGTPTGTLSRPTFTVASSGAIGTNMEVGLSVDTAGATFEGGTGITASRTLTTTSPVGIPVFTGDAGTAGASAEVTAATDLSAVVGVRVYAVGR